jgi:Tol biopolymer transport system component
MAQPFDANKLELRGKRVRLAEDVGYASGYFRAIFGASRNGLLAYMTGSAEPLRRLVRLDCNGKQLGTIGEADNFSAIRFSPDGSKIAVAIGDPPDLWIVDTERGTRTRFTSGRMGEFSPVWAPDGQRIAYASARRIVPSLMEKSLDGMTGEQLLLESESALYPTGWSRDGAFIAFEKVDGTGPGTPGLTSGCCR